MLETKDYNIREATEEDFLELIIFSKEFYLNSHLQNIHSFNSKKTGDMIEDAIGREDFGIFILECEHEIVGVLFSFACPSFFSDDIQALCLAWYIRKEHRSVKNAISLVSVYEEWAKGKGASLINIVNVNLKAPRAFEKLGYRMNEVTFTKEVN